MPLHSSAQGDALKVSSDGGEALGRVGVADASDFLFDDRPFIELRRHVMGRGADQLHSSGVGLVVWLGAFETRKERVVDVDDSACELSADVRGEDLHIAGEDDKVDLVLASEFKESFFGLGLTLRRDRQMLKRNVVGLRKRGEIGMVRHDESNISPYGADAVSKQQVIEAVANS